MEGETTLSPRVTTAQFSCLKPPSNWTDHFIFTSELMKVDAAAIRLHETFYTWFIYFERETVYCCRDPSSHRLLLSRNQTMAAVCVFRCMQEQKSCDFEHNSSNRSQHALVSWKQSSAIIIYGGFHPSQSRTSFQVLLLFPQFANLDLVISRNSVAFVVVYMDSVLVFLECISFGECDLSMCSFKCYTW